MKLTDLPSPGAAERCLVTVRRDHRDDAREQRIFARVDSGAYHEFTFGYSVTVELVPGNHTLRMGRGRRPRAIRFAVAADEHAHFILIGRPTIPGLGFLTRLLRLPPRVTVLRSSKRQSQPMSAVVP